MHRREDGGDDQALPQICAPSATSQSKNSPRMRLGIRNATFKRVGGRVVLEYRYVVAPIEKARHVCPHDRRPGRPGRPGRACVSLPRSYAGAPRYVSGSAQMVFYRWRTCNARLVRLVAGHRAPGCLHLLQRQLKVQSTLACGSAPFQSSLWGPRSFAGPWPLRNCTPKGTNGLIQPGTQARQASRPPCGVLLFVALMRLASRRVSSTTRSLACVPPDGAAQAPETHARPFCR
jgi:hypothetical protein